MSDTVVWGIALGLLHLYINFAMNMGVMRRIGARQKRKHLNFNPDESTMWNNVIELEIILGENFIVCLLYICSSSTPKDSNNFSIVFHKAQNIQIQINYSDVSPHEIK